MKRTSHDDFLKWSNATWDRLSKLETVESGELRNNDHKLLNREPIKGYEQAIHNHNCDALLKENPPNTVINLGHIGLACLAFSANNPQARLIHLHGPEHTKINTQNSTYSHASGAFKEIYYHQPTDNADLDQEIWHSLFSLQYDSHSNKTLLYNEDLTEPTRYITAKDSDSSINLPPSLKAQKSLSKISLTSIVNPQRFTVPDKDLVPA